MKNMNNTTALLNNATIVTREDVLKLNQRQTVLIETNYKKDEGGQAVIESSKRVFLGNYNKRSHAYYDCFIAGGFLHRRGQHEYRLLKLFRCLEELDGFENVEWVKLASYLEEPKPAPQEEEKANEGLSNDEQFGEIEVNGAVAVLVEEPKEGKKKGGKAKKGEKK